MKMRSLLFAFLSMTLLACSSSDDSPQETSEVVNPMTSSYGTLSSKLSRLDFIQGASSSSVNSSALSISFGGNWDGNTDFPD